MHKIGFRNNDWISRFNVVPGSTFNAVERFADVHENTFTSTAVSSQNVWRGRQKVLTVNTRVPVFKNPTAVHTCEGQLVILRQFIWRFKRSNPTGKYVVCCSLRVNRTPFYRVPFFRIVIRNGLRRLNWTPARPDIVFIVVITFRNSARFSSFRDVFAVRQN